MIWKITRRDIFDARVCWLFQEASQQISHGDCTKIYDQNSRETLRLSCTSGRTARCLTPITDYNRRSHRSACFFFAGLCSYVSARCFLQVDSNSAGGLGAYWEIPFPARGALARTLAAQKSCAECCCLGKLDSNSSAIFRFFKPVRIVQDCLGKVLQRRQDNTQFTGYIERQCS